MGTKKTRGTAEAMPIAEEEVDAAASDVLHVEYSGSTDHSLRRFKAHFGVTPYVTCAL